MELSNQDRQWVIRTPDQRLRVFVSSTLKELAEERRVAREAISRLRLAPVMFELGARPHLARDLYSAYLQQSHIFIGIYYEQYGWIAPNMRISGLEEEYRLAKDKPRLIYIKKPAPNREPRLTEMLKAIRDRDGISYKYFSATEELGELIEADLALMLAEVFETSRADATKATARVRRNNIPAHPAPLIGRKQEVQAASKLLLSDKGRLVTFTGPGGSGKTRLSIEAATRLASHFEYTFFVELAAITDPALVADAIAHALGIREAGAKHAEEILRDFLYDKQALLVLDNFEQIAPAASLVANLLENCPWIKFLITSRMALQIRGEREFLVLPLAVPDHKQNETVEKLSQNSAVTLFCERAQAVKPNFTLTEENAPAVVDICRRLDGLPLAIELAAARTRLLSPAEMLKRLEHRLPLLSGGPRDLPQRQRTMRNTIEWSYDLLEKQEATLFRRLAVFAGGFILEAVQPVCDHECNLGMENLEILETLVNKNLIRSRDDGGGETRYEMLETIREYAMERLSESGEEESVLQNHAAYFVEFAETAEPYLTSGQRDSWLRKLEAEIDNIRMVLSHSLKCRIDPIFGIRLAGTLGWFWHLRGYLTEGRNWASSLMKLPEASERTRARAKVLFPAGGLAWSQGDYRIGNAILKESASIFKEVGDLRGLTDARGILAGGLASLGEYDKAQALCEDTVALLRQSGDRWGLAFILYWLGSIILVKTGDTKAVRVMFEEILALSKELQDSWLHAEALNHLGVVNGMQGDYEVAQSYFEASIAYHETTGDRWAIARSLSGFGEVMLRQGNYDGAKSLYHRSALIWREMGNRLGLLTCIAGFAQIAAAQGKARRAALLYGAAPQPVRTIGYLFLPIDSAEYEKYLAPAREELGESGWNIECEKGRNTTLEEAVDFALAEKASQVN